MGPALLKSIIEELGALLTGGVISNVLQPDEKEIILKIFTRGAIFRLLISARHRFSTFHLTERKFENPCSPPRFCAFLRSRITNARITGFRQEPGQRIAHIELKKRAFDAAGTDETFTLTAELTGKSANIILTDGEGIVLDSLKRFQPETSLRAVAPGLKLSPLPHKATPFEGVAPQAGVAPLAEEKLPPKEEGITWNMAVDRLYSELLDEETAGLERSRLRRAINAAEKKLRRKLGNLNSDKKRAEENLGAERLGSLALQSLGRIKRGDTEVTAVDYAQEPPEEVKIPLDPKLGPRANLDKFFKQSKKAKAAAALLKGRIPEVEREIEFIASLIYEWENAKTPEELKELEEELVSEGYLKKTGVAPLAPDTGRKTKADEQRPEPVRRFFSSEGFEILCGKNAAGNDLIVKRYASDEDIWFHAALVPGSHILIKTAGRAKAVTKQTIEEAAALAAWHSKAQGSMKVEVSYTEARHVRKPRGAKPGMVVLREYKTIVVKPRSGVEPLAME